MSASDAPVVITQSEFMRRMKEQQMTGGGGMQMFGEMPDTYQVVFNSNHPLLEKVVGETSDDAKKSMLESMTDLAKLSQGLLKGERLTSFINKSLEQL